MEEILEIPEAQEKKTGLTRLEFVYSEKNNGRWKGYYSFKCNVCGKEIIKRSNCKNKSCGCTNKDKEDLTGKIFGKLKVLEFCHSASEGRIWECECQCESKNIINAATEYLKNGSVRSCGCLKRRDIISKKFGRLTAIKYSHTRKSGRSAMFLFRCDCGKEKVLNGSSVATGFVKSCGCLHLEIVKTHGMSYSPEYKARWSMITRCYNEKAINYMDYGGAGVTICDRWLESFENFYEDMGPRPTQNHSMDRINPLGNYEKPNCRWATPKEQNNNQRRHWLLKDKQISLFTKTELKKIT